MVVTKKGEFLPRPLQSYSDTITPFAQIHFAYRGRGYPSPQAEGAGDRGEAIDCEAVFHAC